MRYAIFSDVHANRQAWEAVRADALAQGADTLICLGDVVGYGPKPLEVLTSVREATPNFVLGNHDAAACGRLDPSIFNSRARSVIEWTRERLDDEAREFLNQVPLQMIGEGIQLVHAEVTEPGEFGYVNGPGPATLNLRAMTQPLAFIGHTHLPLAYTMAKKGARATQMAPIDFQVDPGKRTLVNVGSVGEPRTTDVRASYVIYDDADRQVTFRRVPFDVDGYRRDLEEVGLDIRPYFVEVVDAGMAAEAPSPAASPQLAMAQLPKVAEGVTGDQGQLVLGNAAHPSVPVKQPKIMSIGVIAVLTALVAVTVGGIVIVANRKGDTESSAVTQAENADSGTDRKAAIDPQDPASVAMAANPTPKSPVAKVPSIKEPAPRPEPKTAPAATLSKDLLSYWSFNSNRSQATTRFEQQADGSIRETLVSEKDQRVQALVPKSDIGTDWRDPDFDANGWTQGRNGVGYEDKPADYKNLIQTKAGGAPKKQPHSIYVRIPFKVDDPEAYAGLALYMKFDDGFAAFLNGQPMASKNAPKPLLWNSASTAQNADTKAVVPELFKVNPSLTNLRKGRNVLAIHGLNGAGKPNGTNTGSTSSDLLVLPALVALRTDNTLPETVVEGQPGIRDLAVATDAIKGRVALTGGKFGDAYAFQSGSIDIGMPDKYSIGSKSFSVSLWFNRNRNSVDTQARRLVSAGADDSDSGGWSLILNRAGDTLRFELNDGSDQSTTSAKVSSLSNGDWRHVVATVDRPSGTVRLYLDGTVIAKEHIDLVGRNTITSKSGLSIGRISDPKQRHRAILDDVAIWRRTLAPEEVERIFDSGESLGSICGGEEAE